MSREQRADWCRYGHGFLGIYPWMRLVFLRGTEIGPYSLPTFPTSATKLNSRR